MILTKGLWISLDLDGIGAAISQTLTGEAFFTVIGPERTPGDVYSRYHPLGPEGLPKDDDRSTFAGLYRKLDSLVQNEGFKGPYGEDHPSVYARFEYIYTGSPAELLALLERNGVTVKVRRIPHKGDEDEVEQAKKDFGRWIDSSTEFDPNPKIEEARKREQNERKRKAQTEKAERWDRQFRRFVFFPILFVILTAVLWETFSFHWLVGMAATVLIGFAWWWMRH